MPRCQNRLLNDTQLGLLWNYLLTLIGHSLQVLGHRKQCSDGFGPEGVLVWQVVNLD